MRLPGRVAAAIEVLDEVLTRHRPASEALKDWGKAHRFAGSGDRHVIGTLVYDGLRRKQSAAFASGDDTARGVVFGVLKTVWGINAEDIAQLGGDAHGPKAPDAAMISTLSRNDLSTDDCVTGDFPQWLEPLLRHVFGGNVVREMQALAQRAPIDVRCNALKATRDQVLTALDKYGAVAGPLSPQSVRVAAPTHVGKHVNVETEPAHGMGWFEVQDTASQVAALLTGASPGEKIADICAGAGGKTLALAAMMKNKGQLVAHDMDRRRLRPIFERVTRAGASCIEVIAAEDGAKLSDMGEFDCVVIDAPCTGTGTWRRKPDSKWKLKPATLELRLKDQRDILMRGSKLVRRGGRLAFFTCSVLAEENTLQIADFLAANSGFKIVPYAEQWTHGTAPVSADGSRATLLLTPACHGTDGFFAAILKRVV